MNLDKIIKLCKMISHTYQIIASYFDTDGNLNFLSTDISEEDNLNYYLEQTNSLIVQCSDRKDIQISIDEIALTWIIVPIITCDIIRGYIIIGPFYSNRITEASFIELVKKMDLSEGKKTSLLNYHSIISYYPYKEYIKLIKFVYFHLYEQELNESKLGLTSQSSPENIGEEQNNMAENIDEMEFHGTYLFERCMLECIRTGNLINLKQVLTAGSKGKVGSMSVGNELRQAKNTFLVSAAIASRAAIEGGLNSESALSLSDIYIRQIENMKSIAEISEHIAKMLYDFTGRVHELLRINAYSYYVNQCSEYIQTNVFSNISVTQIAEVLKIRQEHLSRIFKHETGMAVSEYIKKVKVKEAKFLLKYTDNSLVEISEKLAFSSQSHFNTAFKSEMSLTPKQYRDKVKVSSGSSIPR